jgi:hypothetical protein
MIEDLMVVRRALQDLANAGLAIDDRDLAHDRRLPRGYVNRIVTRRDPLAIEGTSTSIGDERNGTRRTI